MLAILNSNADRKTVKTAYQVYEYCIVHISETNKGRDLIFSTDTLLDQGDKIFQSRDQVAPPPQVAPPTCQNLVLTITQRLLKLET